jgi:hypothetical protein
MTNFRRTFSSIVLFLLLYSAIAYGDTWITGKRLTWNAGVSEFPVIAVDGSNIYVAWEDNKSGNYEIYFKKSDDGGTTWITKRLTDNAGASLFPAIAVNGSNIYVAWEDDTEGNPEIYFTKSDDGGTTWTTTTDLSSNAGNSHDPAMAVDGSNIYVIWRDDTPGNPEIYFTNSDDGGTTWTTTRNLSNNAGDSYFPAISVDGSNIYVVWHDWTPGNPEIFFKKSDDRGVTWTSKKRLTYNKGLSYAPTIAVNSSNIYVAWEDDTPGNSEIYLKKSDDGGVTWTTKRLTYITGASYFPSIAVDGSNIYVVWEDNTPGNFEIYFKKSDDGGVTWTTKRLTSNAGVSQFPVIAVNGSNIYVVWHDNRSGNFEIYLKRGILN